MIRSTWRFRVSAKRWSFFTEVTLDEIQDLFFMGILAGWWFQTIWKILVTLGIFPKYRAEN